ncbi:hypothetical protein [Paenibacillus sp. JSM ZJ436]|uniref:hypothetical protein n=1 Tax=Paenibacillus sp. JSM ZJ436 TaxID=3376190 RepID=UPI0037CC6E54
MDQQSARTIKSILQQLNINHSQVLIDREQHSVERQEEDYSIDDLLEAAGLLTPERGKSFKKRSIDPVRTGIHEQ